MITNEEKIMVYAWERCVSGVECLSNETFTVLRKGTMKDDDSSLFLNAKIKIGNKEIEGAVKVINDNKRWALWNSPYKASVILVVTQDPKHNFMSFEYEPIRVFVPKIKPDFTNRYNELSYNKSACCEVLRSLNNLEKEHIVSQLVIERLNDKCQNIESIYKETSECWSDTALAVLFDTMMISYKDCRASYCQLARTIGYNSIVANIISGDYDEDLLNVEALFLGAAGFLNIKQKEYDSYTYTLRARFDLLKKRYNITPMSAINWSSRTTSISFQLAQLAAIIVSAPTLHYDLVACRSTDDISCILKPKLSEYWSRHTSLGVESSTKTKTLFTKFKIENMIINFIVPYLFFYNNVSSVSYDGDKCEELLDLLQSTSDEKNYLVNPWRNYIEIDSAFYSQAVIQLSKKYCMLSNCYKCRLGRKYLDKYEVF